MEGISDISETDSPVESLAGMEGTRLDVPVVEKSSDISRADS